MNEGKRRLLGLRQEVRAMGETLAQHRSRFSRLAGNEIKVVTAFNLFQTPEQLADRMVQMADITNDTLVLEPSAGLGRIYRAIRKVASCPVVLVELAADCAEVLYSEIDSQAKLIQGDFLSRDVGMFDVIVMNPPFKMGTDIKHINHAYSLLKPGGKLVGLCFNGTKQNEKLKPVVDSWEVLPESTFKESGTRASVALITWTK